MRVDGQTYRTVWSDDSRHLVHIIDQRHLPWKFCIENLATVESTATAIRDMHVRGAGCIGVLAAYGMWLAAREAQGSKERLRTLANALIKTRPTARNLAWAVERQLATIASHPPQDWASASLASAESIADEDALWSEGISKY